MATAHGLEGSRSGRLEAGKELKFERHIERALNEWEKTAPTTSLTRRDLLKQAEALEEMAEDLSLDASSAHDNEYHDAGDAMEDAADKALERAQELRRQAEGHV